MEARHSPALWPWGPWLVPQVEEVNQAWTLPSLGEGDWAGGGAGKRGLHILQVQSFIRPIRKSRGLAGHWEDPGKGALSSSKMYKTLVSTGSRCCKHQGKGTVLGMSQSPGLRVWKDLRFGLLPSPLNEIISTGTHSFTDNIEDFMKSLTI